MDELDISGKRYISSKRAAKENRYHVDYIGQLIRAGKIVGSKVGRTWYVEAESLAKYLDQDYAEPTTPAPEPEIYVPTPKVNPVAVKSVEVEQEIEPFDEEEAEKEPERTIEIPSTPVQHITIHKIEEEDIPVARRKTPIAAHPGAGLRYIEDDEPLLPVLGRKERTVASKIEVTTEAPRVKSPNVLLLKPTTQASAPSVQPKTLLVLAGIVGIVAFCGALSLSYFLKSDTTVETANTYSSIHF